MKILLIGAKGQLGLELKKVLPTIGEVIAISRNELDLINLIELDKKLNQLKPAIIVNASAYTAVDMAEDQKELALLINSDVPGVLASYCFKNNAILIHYSTDYIFDGEKNTPYLETDIPNPLSEYGLSKFSGEQKITISGCKHLILRTSWLFSSQGQNFLTTILKLAVEKDEIKVINDQWSSTMSCSMLAQATIVALDFCLRSFQKNNNAPWGIYNVCSNDRLNWHSFAKKILLQSEAHGMKLKLKSTNVIPIPTKDYFQKAKRPKFSQLSNIKFINTFDFDLSDSTLLLNSEISKLTH